MHLAILALVGQHPPRSARALSLNKTSATCVSLGGELETPASIEIAKHTLLSCGLILAIGTLAGFLAQQIRIPDVAIFLLAGITIGPHALQLIDISADSALNQIILLFGASYILFDGGAALRLDVLKRVWITIVVLAALLHVFHDFGGCTGSQLAAARAVTGDLAVASHIRRGINLDLLGADIVVFLFRPFA